MSPCNAIAQLRHHTPVSYVRRGFRHAALASDEAVRSGRGPGRERAGRRFLGRCVLPILTLCLPLAALALTSMPLRADIPATPVMTLYGFNSALEVPYYGADGFARRGATSPVGHLTQGTSLIPCLVIRNGKPLTDRRGTPYVGFEVVVDARNATRSSTDDFKRAVARRKSLRVPNHHCGRGVKHVINVRKMYALEKAPFFDPPASGGRGAGVSDGQSELDSIVRAFHGSGHCAKANRRLIGRQAALQRAWEGFMAEHKGRWPVETLARAKHLDYTMRTALFEGHLERGCNAYGTCERNVIALSIRNRARGQCLKRQGCRFPGDFQGVSSSVSQYNIWDEYLTQISGLTSCFLRPDLSGSANSKSREYYAKLQAMYAQNRDDVERILYGPDSELRELFPNTAMSDLTALRHYYHAPAMGKCFPNHQRVEYMSGAVARKGGDFALIANTRIRVDQKTKGGYRFREFLFTEAPEGDLVDIVDNYPGYAVDGRKVSLKAASGCLPYGVPRGCRFKDVGRYRKTPFWLNSGKPLEVQCHVRDRGAKCTAKGSGRTVSVGGTCDTEMRPVTRVK